MNWSQGSSKTRTFLEDYNTGYVYTRIVQSNFTYSLSLPAEKPRCLCVVNVDDVKKNNFIHREPKTTPSVISYSYRMSNVRGPISIIFVRNIREIFWLKAAVSFHLTGVSALPVQSDNNI